jgi:hypothetical protein
MYQSVWPKAICSRISAMESGTGDSDNTLTSFDPLAVLEVQA